MSSSSFESKIVFGLLVLCVFNSFLADAQLFKILQNPLRSRTAIQQTPSIPLTRQTSNLLARSQLATISVTQQQTSNALVRSHPVYSSQSSLNSNMNLNLPSSGSSNILRSVSLPSLNSAGSRPLMRQITHAEAALGLSQLGALPSIQLNSAASAPIMHRMMPNLNNMGKYLQNGAIAAAGAGGVIQIIEAINGDECCEKIIQRKEEENIESEKRTSDRKNTPVTESPEFYNRVGTDK